MKRKGNRIGVLVKVGAGDFVGKQFYGAFAEYGTTDRAATPFMRPAFDAGGDQAKQTGLREIRDGIEREASLLRKG